MIDPKIIAITMKAVMVAVMDAKKTGIPFVKPGSLLFKFPIGTDATVEFEVNMDWYAITAAKEDELWAKTP